MTDGDRRVLDGIDLLAHPCRRSASSARTARAKSTPMRNRATGETLVSEAISLLRPHDSAEITSEQPGATNVTLIPTSPAGPAFR